MSRTLPNPTTNASTAPPTPPVPRAEGQAEPTNAQVRSGPFPREETLVEQIVFAIVLAILIRAFVAEAFVIPTGSMAPTLMGRHKEITCPQCGFVYAVNASDEVELPAGYKDEDRYVQLGTCSNCRFQDRIGDQPSFKGDRILVMKFPYDLPYLPGAGKPARWDVIVFHYPEEPELNYIKRLIGLPNEDLRVYAGDILMRPRGSTDSYLLQHKPLKHQLGMQMMVYDDRHRPKALSGQEWRRWVGADGRWTESAPGTFLVESAPGARGEPAELVYRHLVADPEQWKAAIKGEALPRPPRASLITDYYSYNTNLTESSRRERDSWFQPHWVGDLTLACEVDAKSSTGVFELRLVRGGAVNLCRIDLATGEAKLVHGAETYTKMAKTAMKGPGRHSLRFANVDGRLTLWVDGRAPFGEGWVYNDGTRTSTTPTKGDLQPASVTMQAGSVAVSDLVIERDVYYTQRPQDSDYDGLWDRPPSNAVELLDRLADPSQFAPLGNVRPHEYPISEGKYMAMGDNSPKSKDGRAWEDRDRFIAPDGPDDVVRGWNRSDRATWEIPESHLVGKAFYVYWPHAVPFGPKIRVDKDLVLPFRPYWERMKWIR